MAKAVKHQRRRREPLSATAPTGNEQRQQPQQQFMQLEQQKESQTDDCARAHALAEIAPHLRETERESGLRDAFAAATAISDVVERARALDWIARHLPRGPAEAIATCREATKIVGKTHPRRPHSRSVNEEAEINRFGNPPTDSIRSDTALSLNYHIRILFM